MCMCIPLNCVQGQIVITFNDWHTLLVIAAFAVFFLIG